MTTTDFHQSPATNPSEQELETFADKVFGDLLGAMSSYASTIGVTLGWYEALAETDSMTSAELAATTKTDERYAREWLEQQTVTGYLNVIDPTLSNTDRRFSISPTAAEVLTNRSSLAYMAPFPGYVTSLGRSLDDIIEAYRTGAGYGWHEHGDGARCGQAEANRPMFLSLLGPEYLASIPAVDAALQVGGRVADIGCGLGWSSIGIARPFPRQESTATTLTARRSSKPGSTPPRPASPTESASTPKTSASSMLPATTSFSHSNAYTTWPPQLQYSPP